MMVSKVRPAVNDDDERVYIIEGYIGAASVSYTTKTTTLIYDVNPGETSSPKEYYTIKSSQGTTGFWNGQMDESLANYLKPGDIVGVHSGGNVFVRFASIDNVIADVIAGKLDGDNQFYGNITKSDTRDNITFGYLDTIDIDDTAIVDIRDEAKAINTREIASDASIMYAEVTINSNGKASVKVCDSSDALSVFDLESFDWDNQSGDFVFKRIYKNGAEKETYVIRFAE
jgi:hypothetical protein